jgi:hypothetical protein
MLLFDPGTGTGKEETVDAKLSTVKALEAAYTAFKENVADTNVLNVMQNVEKTMIGMMDQAKSIQRSMGGVLSNTGDFNNRLANAYGNTVKLGATFDDVSGAVQGLAEGMGRIVSPSQEVIENMTVLSQVTGMSTKEIGGMVSELIRFGGTQKEAVQRMSDMAKEARVAGLNGKQYTDAIGKNLSKVSGFGFKSGVDGMSKMVKQAMLLRTNVEAIGALKMQDSLLEPEGAIEAAANFQMLGGAVGKLADPFQLMYMAQNDMEGLQNELVKSTKAAMTFNQATGKFDVSTQDMYRLRQQAKLTGANLEDLVSAGREAAKLDYIKEKFDLSGLPEEQQNLISQLATIGKDGSLTVDIPGFGEIKADNERQLKQMISDSKVQAALKDYQDNQTKTDRQLAEEQLTVSERQAATVNEIKLAVIAGMSDSVRTKYADDIAKANIEMQAKTTKTATDVGKTPTAGIASKYAEGQLAAARNIDMSVSTSTKIEMDKASDKMRDIYSGKTFDLFVPSGKAPKVMSENKLYEGIVGDEVMMGTNLTEAFNKTGKLNEILSSIGSTSNAGGNTSVNGKIDININLTGAISGDKNADVEKMFSDPKVQKQIMDTVLYKLDSYKRQQGVLS